MFEKGKMKSALMGAVGQRVQVSCHQHNNWDLMLVHFRPHLCSGYTDQYHSFLQKVKSSMITEQNGILIHHGIFVFHIIYFYCKDNTVTSTYYDKQNCLYIISGSKLRSRIGVFWPRVLFSKSENLDPVISETVHRCWTSLFLPLDFTSIKSEVQR